LIHKRLAAAAILAISCSLTSVARAQEVNAKIIGGSFQNSATPNNVALISTPDYSCSGALVGQRAVLTAAHCIAEGPAASQFSVYVGRQWYQVESAWYQSKYDPSQPASVSAKYDLGMLILTRPVTSTRPLAILSGRRLKRGSQITISGYGANEISNDPNRPAIDNLKVGAARVVGTDGRVIFSTFSSNGASTCAGDSGGPASVAYGRSGLALAGIVSAGVNTVTNDNRCELRADGASIYVDLQSPSSKAFLRAFKGLKYVR
jgi:hypothetical protein